ncbi:LacI family transcriptional regulator [Chitinophaga caeni]|uniref:LacI family transcriptional regulator n=1 Tax=Chitinophaga caeni TaxID=2029983 RepID=A0A291QPA2_9BACT|nr:LacI family DNA-binding transcriptional regulator [Chitinophaga caeni]ATL45757.1 LacI family transcriptional regulator [Chitinophaga caeni]
MRNRAEKTIVDIAEALSLSVSTVSRALNDHPNISVQTKDKVRKMARKLGYRPNTLAAGLRSNKSKTVGLIVPRISMFYPAAITTIVQNRLQEYGYHLIICQSNDSYEQEVALVNTLYSARVEALAVSTTLYTTDFSHFDLFKKNNIPVVFFDRVPGNYEGKIVCGDDEDGGYQGAKHLLEKGCKDIVYISGPLTCSLYTRRLEGFKKALQEYKQSYKKSRVFFQELTKENALQTCKKVFSKKQWPDAIFATNDTTAITVLEYCRNHGINVPGQVKIVGYSNDPRTEIVTPSITSIDQDPTTTAERVVAALLELIQQKSATATKQTREIIPIHLIERASSK